MAKASASWAEHWSGGPEELAERFNALAPADLPSLLGSLGLGPLSGPGRSAGSIENRVFFATLEGGRELVIKLYRPGRWGRAALEEEQAFLAELEADGVPVLRPRLLPGGARIGRWRGIDLVVFDRVPGGAPDPSEVGPERLRELGRLAARIHSVGRLRTASGRMGIDARGFGGENLELLARGAMIPGSVRSDYLRTGEALVERAEALLSGLPSIRVHADLGLHNLLEGPEGVLAIDFDDFTMGPPLYDLCELHRGLRPPWGSPDLDPVARRRCLEGLLAGYRELAPLDAPPELVALLRGLRLIWSDAWKQSRLHDPRFREARRVIFTPSFWEARLAALHAELEACR